MATITSSIQLIDRMSAPLNAIIDTMHTVLEVMMDIDEKTNKGFNTAKLRAGFEELGKQSQKMREMGEQIENNTQKQNGFNNALRDGTDKAGGLLGKLEKMAAGWFAWQTVQKVVATADAMTSVSARLNMIARDGEQVDAIQKKIFASAERSRASYLDTANSVASLVQRTGDLFSNTDEAIAFSETLNKMYAIAGTNAEGIASANLQLTQAMGSGVLRGEEFNAIMEAAPNILERVAQSMGTDISQMRDLAKEGKITSAVLKNALLGASEEIGTEFENMPRTWGQVWTSICNRVLIWSQPLLDMITMLANNWETLEPIVLAVAGAVGLYVLAMNAAKITSFASAVASGVLAVAQGVIAVATGGATAAQWAYNAALYACPLTWIVVVVMAVVSCLVLLAKWLGKAGEGAVSVTGAIAGGFSWCLALVGNLFFAFVDLVLGCVNGLVNPFVQFCNFLGNIFHSPISTIIYSFQNLADNVLGVLEKIASALDFVFGSHMADAVKGWRSGLKEMADKAVEKFAPNENYQEVMGKLNLSAEGLGLKRFDLGQAYDNGYAFGASLEEKFRKLGKGADGDLETLRRGMPKENPLEQNVADIAGNTRDIKNAAEMTGEDIKHIVDLAEREAVNRFTTAEIRVDMTNHNQIATGLDIDGIVDALADGVQQAMWRSAEGVYI